MFVLIVPAALASLPLIVSAPLTGAVVSGTTLKFELALMLALFVAVTVWRPDAVAPAPDQV